MRATRRSKAGGWTELAAPVASGSPELLLVAGWTAVNVPCPNVLVLLSLVLANGVEMVTIDEPPVVTLELSVAAVLGFEVVMDSSVAASAPVVGIAVELFKPSVTSGAAVGGNNGETGGDIVTKIAVLLTFIAVKKSIEVTVGESVVAMLVVIIDPAVNTGEVKGVTLAPKDGFPVLKVALASERGGMLEAVIGGKNSVVMVVGTVSDVLSNVRVTEIGIEAGILVNTGVPWGTFYSPMM